MAFVKQSQIRSTGRVACLMIIGLALLIGLPSLGAAFQGGSLGAFQNSIVDYRSRLNPHYKKVVRSRTKYIIVHTSELGLHATLRVVARGKRFPSGHRTYGGHTHYVIARNGRCYRILDKRYVADHAGRSMWNGETDISQLSIGIELVGYHYAAITDAQYRSLGRLIAILQNVYHLNDKAVLTHSQVAYGRPNRWFHKDHRGRKRCAKNFIRTKAGLGPTWPYDPDVRAGRLTADTQLAKVFYGRDTVDVQLAEANVISKRNTAWAIAGEDFDSAATVYQFPDGRAFAGDQIGSQVGWDRIPARTVVLLNQESGLVPLEEEKGPVKTISDGITAWSLAGRLYNRHTTIYFLPSGHVKTGAMIDDWDDLPVRTRLIIGYRGPYELRKDRSAYRIAGKAFNAQDTIYYLPSNQLLSGNAIKDFSRLQAGTLVFLPARL